MSPWKQWWLRLWNSENKAMKVWTRLDSISGSHWIRPPLMNEKRLVDSCYSEKGRFVEEEEEDM